MRLAILVLVAACSSHATKPSNEEAMPARGSTAPKRDASTIDAPRGSPPKVDTACKDTMDCTLTSDTFEDDAPRTYACCPGCSDTAVSRQSFEPFQRWCRANQPPMCPPLGCAMPQMLAVCEAGHCVAKDARAITKPDVPKP